MSTSLLLDEFPEETTVAPAAESFDVIDLTPAVDTPLSAEALFRAERMTGVGGSDAGVVVGLSPWKTPYELWLEKTGQVEPADLSENAAVQWGIKLEDLVAEEFARQTGKRVRRNTRLLRSKAHPYMIAHVDRDVVGEPAILECKTVGAHFDRNEWGASGTDMVPPHYLLQCQHYLAVTGRQVAYLAVLIGGRDFRIYNLPRDKDVIESLVGFEGEFWQHVCAGTPPEFDPAAPGALAAAKRIFAGTNGETIDLGSDVFEQYLRWSTAKEAIKTHEQVRDEAEAAIRAAMGEAAVGKLPDGTAFRRQLVVRKGYTVEETDYVSFRHVKKIKD